MNNQYQISRWVFFYAQKNNFALLNAKSLEVLYVDAEVKNIVRLFKKPISIEVALKKETNKTVAKKTITQLIKLGYLVDSDTDELTDLYKETTRELDIRKKSLGKDTQLNSLRVVLTEKCPFRCQYCFVKNKKDISLTDLSWESLKKGIDLLIKLNPKKGIELQFFGGEPLVRFDLIQQAVEYIEEQIIKGKIKQVHYGITTNGALVDDKKAKFLKEKSFLVSVSLDGWKELNDLNRQFANKEGTFSHILRGLEILKKHHNDIGILVTPSKTNIDQLADACEYIIKDLKFKFITINTPQPVNGNWEVDGKKFSLQLKKCFKVAEENNAVINHFGTRTLFALNEKLPMAMSCSKFGNDYTATLSPDGKVSPCIVSWEHPESLNKLDNFSYSGNFSNWKLANPYAFKKCVSCPAMNICGGPCPLELFEMKKHGQPSEHERCKFFEDFLKWSIWYGQS